MQPKNIAREWLLLIGGLAFGLLVQWPIIIYIYDPEKSLSYAYGNVLGVLFGKEGFSNAVLGWVMTLGLYLLIQIIRSIVWAVRVIKS